MKILLLISLLSLFASASAQTAGAFLQRSCGPKDAAFNVSTAKLQQPKAPEPGKALVYFIQDQSGALFTTRIGMDGSWIGVVQHDSYIFASVKPGEHHVCAATLNRRHLEADLIHFNVVEGQTYYYLLRGIGGVYDPGALLIGPADLDEALFLIASDPQSVATPERTARADR